MAVPASDYATNTSVEEILSSTEEILRLLQQTAMQNKRVGLITTTFQFAHEANRDKITQSMQHFLEKLRSLVRKSDGVIQLDQTCYFLLGGANQEGTEIVQERLWEALLWAVHNIHDREFLCPRSIEAGHSTYPDPFTTLESCLQAGYDTTVRFAPQEEKSARATTTLPGSEFHRSIEDSELPLLARQLGIPYLSLLPRKLPTRIQRLISPSLAQELRCYPLGRERDILTVAMADPQDQAAIDRLQQETRLRIFPVLVHPEELQNVLDMRGK